MITNEVDKPKVTKTVVVYSGRFQPFHSGHYATYKHLISKFGADNVFIGTSNDTSSAKSPFNFKEKKKIATTMFPIPSDRFVQIKNPYQPVEILDKYDPKTTQYVAVVGEKDAGRLRGKYFKPYKGKAGYGYEEIGYVYASPAQPNPISGTEVRANLGGDDEKKAKEFFKTKAYGNFNQKIFDLITKRLSENINVEHYDPLKQVIANIISDAEIYIEDIITEKGLMDRPVDWVDPNTGKKKKSTVGGILRKGEEHPAYKTAKSMVDKERPKPTAKKEPKEPTEPKIGGQPMMPKASPQQRIDKLNPARAKEKAAIKQGELEPGDGLEQGEKPQGTLEPTEFKTQAETPKQKEKQKEKFGERVKEKLKNWSEEEKEFFKKHTHKPGSEQRKSWGERVMDKAKGAGVAIKHGLKHEAEEFKTAGLGIGKLMSGKKLDDNDKKALKDVGIKIVTTALFAAAGGAVAHGALGFAGHVALELIPHAIAEVLIKGVGRAALFANSVVDYETNLNIFAAAIAERLQNMEISPKIMEDMIDSYNINKLKKKFKNESFNQNLSEGSSIEGSSNDDQPDGMFLPKGKKRKLGSNDGINKSDEWFTNGGYIQIEYPQADPIFGDEYADAPYVVWKVKNLPRTDFKPTKFNKKNPISESLMMEGGAYGHMSHPFEDMDLTFGDLKNIITGALNGRLELTREKTDGQALAISWKNGRLIAARNKGHLANAGANAMGIEEVASKFAGRGGLTDAYNFAMKDLSAAISGLSEAQRKKIFNEGQCFMNLEVIWPESVNVIPYGQALLVFHNTTCYDESGVAISANQSAARILAGMIKQINADVQSKYTIQGPPINELPKNQELSSKQSSYLSKLKRLQSKFGLSDGDSIFKYHEMWWDDFINKKAPIKVDKLTKEALIRRWAFGDKSFRLNTISNEELQAWAIQTDKTNVEKQRKENIMPFEELFLSVGSDVLSFVTSVLTVHPDTAIRNMKDRLKSVSEKVKQVGDPKLIQKLKYELSRLNKLGGIDKIVAAEGIVFVYNGKTYKLTGTFAPLNQILGLFY